MKVKCPKCGKVSPWEGNAWRPFCSERCKMVDLGAWVSGDYAIPGEDDTGGEEDEDTDAHGGGGPGGGAKRR